MLGCKENLDHQDGRADHDRAIGDIEVGPDILANKELEEIDNVSREDAVPKIPKRSTENERQGEGCAVESLSVTPQKGRNYYESQQRKEDQKNDAKLRG